MELIARIGLREIWLKVLQRPYDFQSPFPGDEFVCILFANDPTTTQAEQNRISDQLVAAGCKYAVCAGFECSSWDDAIDWAYLATDENYSPSDETFVMTTRHEDEPTSEVIWHGLHCTDFGEHHFSRYLVLMIGSNPDLENEIRQAVLKEAGDVAG